MWNVYVEPREPESLCGTVVEPGTFMEPQKCGTLRNLNLSVETLWTLEPFGSGTFMWNLGEPGSRFRAAAPNQRKGLKLKGSTRRF